jgi:hypothetical protein
MLDTIIEYTDEYISSKPKTERKSFGQFFTSKKTLQYSGQMNQNCSKHGVAEFVNFISNLQISFQIGYVSDNNTSQRLCVCPTVL